MDQLADDEYECFTCKRKFRSRVFSISKEWDRVDFDDELPCVEIRDAYGIECYCSKYCAVARRHLVMLREGVPITWPGTEPIELCSKCRAPVDMTEFHLTYVESQEVHESSIVMRTVDMDYLAVLCRKCQPLPLSERTLEFMEERPTTTQFDSDYLSKKGPCYIGILC